MNWVMVHVSEDNDQTLQNAASDWKLLRLIRISNVCLQKALLNLNNK